MVDEETTGEGAPRTPDELESYILECFSDARNKLRLAQDQLTGSGKRVISMMIRGWGDEAEFVVAYEDNGRPRESVWKFSPGEYWPAFFGTMVYVEVVEPE